MSIQQLFIDIETIPTQNIDVGRLIKSKVKAPSNYKDPQKIDDYVLKASQEALERTGLRPEGEIVCLSYAVNDDQPASFMRYDDNDLSEVSILEDFALMLKDLNEPGRPFTCQLVGHNAIGFDVPRIWQRCKVYDIMLPSFWPAPWEVSRWRPMGEVLDTMYAFSQDPLVSLEVLAAMLGIETDYPKIGEDDEQRPVTGADVYDLWIEGKDDIIRRYCEEDVAVVRHIAHRLTG